MPYSKLLQKIVATSNLTSTEIIKKCKEDYDITITEGHFSRILNNRRQAPKEEVSRAISRVCNVDERLLVIEGYIDKAPKEILEALKLIQYLVNTSTLVMSSNLRDLNKETLEEMKQKFENEPIAETLLLIMDDQENSLELLESNLDFSQTLFGTNINIKIPEGIPIEDDGMAPVIESGDKVIFDLKTSYNTSDIVIYKPKEQNTIKARILTKVNSTFVMIPINKKYKQEIYAPEDITIIGKVSQVIKNI